MGDMATIRKLIAEQEPRHRHHMALALQALEDSVFYYAIDVLWATSPDVWRIAWPIEMGRMMPVGIVDKRIKHWRPMKLRTVPHEEWVRAVEGVIVELLNKDGKRIPRVYLSVLQDKGMLMVLTPSDIPTVEECAT